MNGPLVAMDARLWRHAGIGRYVRELAAALSAEGTRLRLLMGAEAVRSGELPPGAERADVRAGIYSLAEQWDVPRAARGADLLHVPHFNAPLARLPIPLVVTVHDLIYLHDASASGRFGLGRAYTAAMLAGVARRAAAVVTVSEYSRRDLLDSVKGLRPDRVVVVPEAPSARFSRRPEAPWPVGVPAARGPFVLYVGSLKPHKNLPALVRAMAAVRAKGLPHELLIVGRADRKRSELPALLAAAPFARWLEEVPDEGLVALYNRCDAFVLPSFIEGFGLPVLEAMACGAPVLASERTSLPEVGGDAARYFDPARVDALSELLYTVLSDAGMRRQMSAAGLERARRFSWHETARRTLDVYRLASS